MNLRKTLPLILSLSFLFVACQQSAQTPDSEGVESQIQNKIEEAGEDAGNTLKNAGEDAGKVLEDAKNATEKGLDDAKKTVGEGVKDAGSALEKAGDAIKDATN